MENNELNLEELEIVSGGANGGQYYLYTVKKGDTLSGLAKRFHTTVDAIYKLNSDKIKDKNLIKIGWKLLIPKK